MQNINSLESSYQPSLIENLTYYARRLGIDKIKNRKIKRLVVNTFIALSFLSTNSPKVLAQDGGNCIVTNSNNIGVNIRNGAGIDNAIVGSLSPDEVAQYSFSQHGWNFIAEGDVTGWVSQDLTSIKNCNTAHEMIEGLNDNSGVVLPFREYPQDNVMIFGTQDVLTDEQILELHRFLGEKTGSPYYGDCEQTRPVLIIFVNVKQLHQLQRGGLGRLDFHSFQGIVDFDGTTLTATNYCSSNSNTAAVINVEEAFPFQSLYETTVNVTAHEISHVWQAVDEQDRRVYQNDPLQLNGAYYIGEVARAASQDRCLFFTNQDTINFCNELGEIVRES